MGTIHVFSKHKKIGPELDLMIGDYVKLSDLVSRSGGISELAALEMLREASDKIYESFKAENPHLSPIDFWIFLAGETKNRRQNAPK